MVTIKYLAARLILLILVTTVAQSTSKSDYWKLMDSGYDTSYLEPVDELVLDNVLACASESLFRNVTAFGYGVNEDLCILLNVDYYVEHDWTPMPDMKVFLRNEDIHNGTCVDSVCGMCMQVLGVPMTWADSERACGDVSGYLFAVWSAWVHRCIVMQLQYLRKPTTNVYWLGGANHLSEARTLWAPGQPNNSEECVLLDSGDHYRLFTADCSEKHHTFCYLPEGK